MSNINIQIPEPFKELFNPKWRNLVWYGGRGSMKSWTVTSGLLIKSLQEKHKILCGRQFQNSINDSVKSLLDKRINDLQLNEYFESTNNKITSINGSEFIFKGLQNNITSVQSIEDISIAFLEESQSINQRSIDVLVPTVRKKGSQLIWIYNPYMKEDPVHQMFVVNKRPNTFIRKINYGENPWFKESPLYQEMLYDKKHDYDKYLWKWEGNCLKISEAAVFKDKIKIESFEVPKDVILYGGMDYGFSVDPFAILTCWIDHDRRRIYINDAARKVHLEIDDTPKFIEQSIPKAKEINFIADSARPELISYLRKRGFKVTGAKKGKDSVIEGIEFIKSYTIIIHEKLKDLIHEFYMYSYKIDPHTGIILPKLQDGDDHYVDSLRYCLESTRRPKAEIAFV